MALKVLKYKQHDLDFISFIMPFEMLNKLSKVLVYNDQTGEGYQRKPNDTHVNRIKNDFLSKLDNFYLPTSVILGADKAFISKLLTEKNDSIELSVDKINDKIFNVVDGQHRLKGLERASESLQGEKLAIINNFQFNVVCVLTNESNRSVEVDIFVDINSKSKRVSTDLAELARFNYSIKEQSLNNDIKTLSEHVSLVVARELNEKKQHSVWNNAIKFDIHADSKLGIIGVSSFRKSITGLAKAYIISEHPDLLKLEGQELIKKCFEVSVPLAEFLYKCWEYICSEKWKGCFKQSSAINDNGEIVEIKFNKNFYLQKPPGVFPVHRIIEDLFSKSKKLEKTLEEFLLLIDSSSLTSNDWKMGGRFAGFNSQSGFNKIKDQILKIQEE